MRDYITQAPRMIQGKWLKGLIKRSREKRAQKAFHFFCDKLMQGKPLEEALKVTQEEFEDVIIIFEECKERFPRCAEPIYEVRVG